MFSKCKHPVMRFGYGKHRRIRILVLIAATPDGLFNLKMTC